MCSFSGALLPEPRTLLVLRICLFSPPASLAVLSLGLLPRCREHRSRLPHSHTVLSAPGPKAWTKLALCSSLSGSGLPFSLPSALWLPCPSGSSTLFLSRVACFPPVLAGASQGRCPSPHGLGGRESPGQRESLPFLPLPFLFWLHRSWGI